MKLTVLFASIAPVTLHLLRLCKPYLVSFAGEEWLATHRRDPRARDVALSTALAHMAVAEQLSKKQV